MTFTDFVRNPDSNLVYGLTPEGRYIGFETPEQFWASGGAQDFSNVRSIPGLQVPGYQTYSQASQDEAQNSVTGNSTYDSILGELNSYLNKLKQNGQMINPNVDITPDKIQEFVTQAQSQIHPYYATQLKAATDTFLKGLGYSSETLAQKEQDLQKKYGNDLRTLSENAAENGLTLSGRRKLDQNNLASEYQGELDSGRRDLNFAANHEAADFARTYGGDNLPTAPTLGGAPRVLPGSDKFDTSAQGNGLYQLSPDIYRGLIGSEQNNEKSATDSLSSKLQENYRTGLANQQIRQLTL